MSPCSSLVPVLVGCLFALGGCMTSGQVWVQQPEDALTPASAPELARASFAEPSPLLVAHAPTTGGEETGAPPRHRLDRVISLGEAAPGAPASSADASVNVASGPAPVVVNIVKYVAPGYSGYGSITGHAPRHARSRSNSDGHRSKVAGPTEPAPVNTGTRSTPPAAGERQAPRSHGTVYPYRSVPASALQRPR